MSISPAPIGVARLGQTMLGEVIEGSEDEELDTRIGIKEDKTQNP